MARDWFKEEEVRIVSERKRSHVDEHDTTRLEAFSDGVLAIAITLLVLDLHLPGGLEEATNQQIFNALINLWPTLLAFTTSFVFIGIMWINHHRLFKLIQHTDTVLFLLNLLLLFGISVLPFPTALMAEHLGHPGEEATALFYGGVFIFIALCFNALWRYAAHDNRLLDKRSDPIAVQKISRQYLFGPLIYLVLFLLALVSVPLFLFGNLVAAIFFALPGPPMQKIAAGAGH